MAGRNSFPLNEFVAAVREDITGWCVAAIVSSVLLLLVYSALPDVRRTPGWQFLFSSICEIYVAVGFLVLSLDDEAQVDPASDRSSADVVPIGVVRSQLLVHARFNEVRPLGDLDLADTLQVSSIRDHEVVGRDVLDGNAAGLRHFILRGDRGGEEVRGVRWRAGGGVG